LKKLEENFEVKDVVDISPSENNSEHLEGTGAIVFDHINKVAYACISERCNEKLFRSHCKILQYKPIAFHAFDTRGTPIYHTNVLMGIQTNTVVICAESITDEAECKLVVGELYRSGRDIITITQEQLGKFCGNILELHNSDGERFLMLSRTAYDGFTTEQHLRLAKDKKLVPISIPLIEHAGGGSVRCMIAEIFLKPKVATFSNRSHIIHKA
jgi:hypothetical protein